MGIRFETVRQLLAGIWQCTWGGALRRLWLTFAALLYLTAFAQSASAAFDAELVEHDLPAEMFCETGRIVKVKMKNTGTGNAEWTEAALEVKSTEGLEPALGTRFVPKRTVTKGGRYAFSITITAPLQNLASRNRQIQFQMRRPESKGHAWFGEVLTWTVRTHCPAPAPGTDHAEIVATNLPDTLACGEVSENGEFWIEMKNMGAVAWGKEDEGYLGQHLRAEGNPFNGVDSEGQLWPVRKALLPPETVIEPFGVHRFPIKLRAPEVPGVHEDAEWRMAGASSPFGPPVQHTIAVQCDFDSAAWVGTTIPTELSCGSSEDYTVTFKNAGNTRWRQSTGYSLRSKISGLFPEAKNFDIAPDKVVRPGKTYEFPVRVVAPRANGSYSSLWVMRKDGVAFSNLETLTHVVEDCPPPGTLDAEIVWTATDLPNTTDKSMQCGGTYDATLTLRNTGSTTWSEPPHRLKPLDQLIDPFWKSPIEGAACRRLGQPGHGRSLGRAFFPFQANRSQRRGAHPRRNHSDHALADDRAGRGRGLRRAS